MLNALTEDNSPFDAPQLERLKTTFEALNADQSLWLSGYLAGLNAVPAPGANAPPTETALTILFASETGNGEGVARELAARLERSGQRVELASFDGFRPARLNRLRRAVFVVSTHGEGDPPEDALDLFEFLRGDRAPQLSDLQFRVLALGDRSYEQFCAAGRWLEERLQELGATPFGPRVDCDVDYAADSEGWMAQVLEWVGETTPAMPTAHPAPTLSLLQGKPRWTRENPFVAPVLHSHPVTGRDSTKDVMHIELSLEGSGIRYAPGDAIGVWAPNGAETVAELLEALELDGDAPVMLDDERLGLAEALTDRLEITRLSPDLLESWSRVSTDFAQHWGGLDRDRRRAFYEARQLIDIAARFPVSIDAGALVGLLRPLAPRSYSIASSGAWVDDEVHLTVATHTSAAEGAPRHGVASHYLNHRLQPGDTVRVFPEPNPRFHLPAEADAPLILVAAGTGIAPYRAFLQEIEARGSGPQIWLLFGNPHQREDFLYQREWLKWREAGLVTRIDAAWSRDQTEKRYVQHLVAEQAGRIVDWLERGAHVYLCGALAMGAAVQAALESAFRTARGLDQAAATEALRALRREKRLHRDLY